MSQAEDLSRAISGPGVRIHPVVPFDFSKERVVVFDLTADNEELAAVDMSDTGKFTDYIFGVLERNGSVVGIGKYNEDRAIYARSPLFGGKSSRSVHLGIDIWAAPGTRISSPLPARVHSFNDNDAFGDYGPTIILDHEIGGVRFYTLYGHLTRDSISGLEPGMEMPAGREIARIGDFPGNGSWPPHLHFQVIADMQGNEGDFPGVSSLSDRHRFLSICPDPNIILRIPGL